MKRTYGFLAALFILFTATATVAQNNGTVTSGAFAIGKGAGNSGYTSLLCASAQLAVGQSAAAPICRTISGDGTLSAGGVLVVTKTGGVAFGPLATAGVGTGLAIGGSNLNLQPAAVGTIGGVNAITCATHQWLNTIATNGLPACFQPAIADISGFGTGVATALGVNIGSAGAPVLFNGAGGVPLSLTLTNATGLPLSGLTGLGTGIATALGVNIGSAGAPVLFNGAGGLPSSLTLTNATGLPLSGLTGFAANVATWLGTPSSANLRAALTDETGTGLAYFQGGDIGTPSAGVGTNFTGTAAGFTAGHVTTNANLTGDVTSIGNATTYNNTVPASKGGTGQATLTANAFIMGNGTSPVNMVAVTGLVLGNGASAPSAYAGTSCTSQFVTALSALGVATCSTLGTGVFAALGVSIGSAGAPVLFNGALGTPLSGVATNLTGTASGLTAGAVPASGITGTTLPASVVTSSLTSLGTLTALTVNGSTASFTNNSVGGLAFAAQSSDTGQTYFTITNSSTGGHGWQFATAGQTQADPGAFYFYDSTASKYRFFLSSLGNAVIGDVGSALPTNANNGFLYIPTTAGTPTGTPTSYTGHVALLYDTTNHQFWIYDGGWKQPKTPAGAATVTWQ